MQNGFELIKRVEGKRTTYEINGESVKPVIIRQLEKRGVIEVKNG